MVGKSALPVSYDGAGPHASLAACVVPATDEGRIEAAPALASWARLTWASLRRPAEHFQRPLTHSLAVSSYR